VQLAEVQRFEDSVTYDDYLADFSASFHDLRSSTAAESATGRSGRRHAGDFEDCLDRKSYVASQTLAERLLSGDSLGVVYPSVRHAGGTCVACFRPALVGNVRRARTHRFTWTGSSVPVITVGR
jgi:hypothetical protein